MKRSNIAVMIRMMGLVRPLAGVMVLAIGCGVVGFFSRAACRKHREGHDRCFP